MNHAATPPDGDPGAPPTGAVAAAFRRYVKELGYRRGLSRLLGPDTDPDYNFTDFLFRIAQAKLAGTTAVRKEAVYRLEKTYQAEKTKTALSYSAGGTYGGYLVPEELRYDLMADIAEEGIFRPRANVVEMNSAVLELPLPDATSVQSAGQSPFLGGMTVSWKPEAAARSESEPALRLVELRAHDLTAYANQSANLYRDGGRGLESWLRKLFAKAIAWGEDYAFFQGSGEGQPLGVINSNASKLVTRNAASKFDNPNDLASMAKAFLPQSWPRAIWAVSPTVWAQMVILGSGASGVSPSWQTNQPFDGGVGGRGTDFDGCHFVLNGRPGFVTEKLPALGTKGDVVLFDPSLYILADRQAVEIDLSFDEPTAFPKNQCVWRVLARLDGQPQFSSTVQLADGSTSCSPYVVLN